MSEPKAPCKSTSCSLCPFRREELQEKDERSLVGVTSRGGGSGKTVTLEEFGNDLTKVWG